MNKSSPVDILLVEDNSTDAELAMRALRKGGAGDNINWVQDGVEALDFIFRNGNYSGRPDENPKVILLDLKMPKMNGIEVLKQIRQNERTRSIPVVMVTSSAEKQDIDESYRLGVNSYVVKPVEFGEFSDTMQKSGHYWTRVNATP